MENPSIVTRTVAKCVDVFQHKKDSIDLAFSACSHIFKSVYSVHKQLNMFIRDVSIALFLTNPAHNPFWCRCMSAEDYVRRPCAPSSFIMQIIPFLS